jgi:hypothetical protein
MGSPCKFCGYLWILSNRRTEAQNLLSESHIATQSENLTRDPLLGDSRDG